MGTAIAKIQDQWNNAELVRTLKETVCRGATDAQFRMFAEVCKRTGLDPFLREIWFVPSVGIIAARDGYLRVANEHPQFDGMETRVERDSKSIPIKAVCTVWRKDRNHPTICEAYFNEYKNGNSTWTKYPSAMISKVAEVLSLKRSFSINGVVSEEEMGPVAALPPTADQQTEQKTATKKAQPIQQPRTPEPQEDIMTDAVPPKLAEILKRVSLPDKFAKLQPFQDLKADLARLLGDDDQKYYEILHHHGVEKSDQFKSLGAAKACATMLYNEVQRVLAEITEKEQVPYQASEDDVALGEVAG